jgi:RNA-directed DNA polymerase
MGKLDAMAVPTARPDYATGAMGDVMVNGPEGVDLNWDAIDWRKVEDDVRQLRQRIFTASQAGDLKRVRNLQKLMLRSRSNALLSVRRVTELNAGRKTAGVDGKVVLVAQEKAELVSWLQQRSPWKPKPVKPEIQGTSAPTRNNSDRGQMQASCGSQRTGT